MVQVIGVLVFIACLFGAGWEILKFVAGLLGLRGWDQFLGHWLAIAVVVVVIWLLVAIFSWLF